MIKKVNISETDIAASEAWMKSRNWTAQSFQKETWVTVHSGISGIVNAPTGSGKTYSLLLPFLMSCLHREVLPDKLLMIWITPIRALAKEIKTSADRVISETTDRDQNCNKVRVAIRTGDTSEAEKASQKKNSPHILITTPESLHLMLARKGCNAALNHLEIIVIDEWHDLLGSKRGVMIELALSRLRGIQPGLLTWGISATIGNMEGALETLLGPENREKGKIIRSNIKKNIGVVSIIPEKTEKMPWSGHLGIKMIDSIIPIIEKSNSTLIFTNVRSQCEIWYRKILETAPGLAGLLAMHHGSISREIRHWVEDALGEGRLKAVVCTSSLDLGVDFAPVETIIQIGGPKGVARFLQRAGRSGHQPGAESKIYFLPTNSLELIEAAALREAISKEYLEDREPIVRCFDVLIQYLVTLSVGDGFREEDIYEEIKNTFAFQTVSPQEWQWIISFIATGGKSLQAYTEQKRIVLENGLYKIASLRLARRHRLSIGTIVSDTMMIVKFRRGGMIGHIEESFISQLNEGDNFWFAGINIELVQVKELTAYVKKSSKPGGRSPVWLGGRLPLSSKMSDMIREQLDKASQLNAEYLQHAEIEIQKIQPLLKLQKERSIIPAKDEFLIELFHTDEGYHTVFYPFEGRFVHEGLAALFAYRISRLVSISFSLAYNDYGFELLSDQPFDIEEALGSALTDLNDLEQHITSGVNATEMAKREFRDIAAISGLVFKGYPGQPVKERHLHSSSQLFFQVFEDYDPNNLLLRQAYDDVIQYKLEMPRLRQALSRINNQKIIITRPSKPTPFAFPIMVDRLRERMTSETLQERIAKMVIEYEE